MNPLFTIITATYNADSAIRATLDSIASQSCGLFEWVVVDGASSDDTLAIVREASIPSTRIISERDRGLYDAMNKGIRTAKGDYLIFLNAGDAFHSPDTLQTIADAILKEGNDYPGVVYGQTQLVNDQRQRIGDRHLTAPEILTFESFAEGMVVCHQAFVVLRKLARPFNLKYRFSADYDWCIRILQRSRRNVYIPAITIDYLYEGLSTKNRRKSLTERFRIMCKYYGTLPTLLRHLSFVPRFIRHKAEIAKAVKSKKQHSPSR